MRRGERPTLPQTTLLGKISSYEDLEPLLVDAELDGRAWAHERSQNPEFSNRYPTDQDIYDLHRVMFQSLYQWAGQPRNKPYGPGGIEWVPWSQVRIQLRQRFQDLGAQYHAAFTTFGSEIPMEELARLIATSHHQFQYVHPFADTNGRTGRVLDHFLIWGPFGLSGPTIETSPIVDHFETQTSEDDYYTGLEEADAGYMARLESFYAARLEAAVASAEALE